MKFHCPVAFDSLSLRLRILVALTCMLLPVFLVQAYHQRDILDDLRRNILLFQAKDITFGRDSAAIRSLPAAFGEDILYYTLYSPEGKLLWYAPHGGRPRRLKPMLLDEGQRYGGWFSHFAGEEISVPVRLTDGNILMVSKRDVLERAALDRLLGSRSLRGASLTIGLGVLVVLFMAVLLRWTMRPVNRAAALTRRIVPDDPGRGVPVDGLPPELRGLAEAANDALRRLGLAYEREKRFVSDAAHQLRTPLTVLGLLLEEGRRGGKPDWVGIRREFRHMERLVFQLGRLAKSDRAALTARSGAVSPADLSRAVREAAVSLLPLFEKEGRTLEADIADGLRCACDAGDMRELVGNLLENALLHGKGATRLCAGRQGGRIIVDVTDEGDGVPEELREDMFRRFSKRDPNSDGSGLGLAIARQIARNAGGNLAFVSSPVCVIRLDLPEIPDRSPQLREALP